MRTLKYAILGLIQRRPMTGYDISREFRENALSSFWHAKHSQIYPELKRLLDEGMITCQTEIQGERMEKKRYTITPVGRREFLGWLSRDEEPEPTPKDIFRLRTYYSDQLSPTEHAALLAHQTQRHRSRLSALLEEEARKFPQRPAPQTAEAGDFMVLRGAILRETSYLTWLEQCTAYVT